MSRPSKEVWALIRLRTLLIAGVTGIVLAFFLDPESGENRRDKFGKSFGQMIRRGRKQVDSTTKTLRKVAS
jgi:gas vesicle protein